MAGSGQVGVATVLFTDIEGFTSICESQRPEALIASLNEYFDLITRPIQERGGVITQFQGDAVLATFNVPEKDPRHASQAISAALDIQRALQGRTFGNGIRFNTRIGINTGEVVGGLVGTGDRVVFTVHGDDVNLAARLEALNKEYGSQILVSDSTRRASQAVDPEQYSFVPLGEVAVRGRTEATTVYAVSLEARV